MSGFSMEQPMTVTGIQSHGFACAMAQQPMAMTGTVNGFATFGPAHDFAYTRAGQPIPSRLPIIGPYNASEIEFQRLQKFEWNAYRDRINDGMELIRKHWEPQSAFQEGSLRIAELETGYKWQSKPDPFYFMPEIPRMPEIWSMPTTRLLPEIGYKPWKAPTPITLLDTGYKPWKPPEPVWKAPTPITLLDTGYKPWKPPEIDLGIEVAPIVYYKDPLTVFKGFDNSHISYVDPMSPKAITPDWHITTQIGKRDGFDTPFSVHNFLKDLLY